MAIRVLAGLVASMLGACAHHGDGPALSDHVAALSEPPQVRCTYKQMQDPARRLRVCRLQSASEWQALGLVADGDIARSALTALTATASTHEHRLNHWLFFVPVQPDGHADRILDTQGWMLDSVLQTDVSKAGCASVRPVRSLLDRARSRQEPEGDAGAEGEGEDPSDGKRCGNIAVIHSLMRLGVLKAEDAFEGEHLKRSLVERIDRFHDAHGGMTADQQRRAYKDFDTPARRIECTTTGLAGSVDEPAGMLAAAELLSRLMASTEPVFDCSLAVRGDIQADGTARFRHVEHVKAVRRADNGEYEIDTLDGLNQGNGSAGIPRSPATNTWGIGPGWIQFKTSSNAENRRRFSEESFHAYDMRCCYQQ